MCWKTIFISLLKCALIQTLLVDRQVFACWGISSGYVQMTYGCEESFNQICGDLFMIDCVCRCLWWGISLYWVIMVAKQLCRIHLSNLSQFFILRLFAVLSLQLWMCLLAGQTWCICWISHDCSTARLLAVLSNFKQTGDIRELGNTDTSKKTTLTLVSTTPNVTYTQLYVDECNPPSKQSRPVLFEEIDPSIFLPSSKWLVFLTSKEHFLESMKTRTCNHCLSFIFLFIYLKKQKQNVAITLRMCTAISP